ncbi:hypothetical protein HOE37_00120 [Candidatus Woesearchaeota archaeon]|jgi:hypothetical protein|nr:hypothetical protein [Candidatus Woesearchaeota archaeon]MBT4110242.1 hypothetical protein [Candidatus Woesearchaeota archaeon]MBT4336234.1 hypothetical protein [Candidatus Woesearchaeota archaeon]MBT4468787.1 hypothetical protein [Candidatus Woesearchaeota archaeon]MBT6744894.1 hypothetical protein [Candidatus Woesearchaeota archaeon]
MKKIILMLSLLVIAMFLVGCTGEVSDEELNAELEELSDEEFLDVISDEEPGALAGQARAIPISRVRSKIKKLTWTCTESDGQVIYDSSFGSKLMERNMCLGNNLNVIYCDGNELRWDKLAVCNNGCENGACIGEFPNNKLTLYQNNVYKAIIKAEGTSYPFYFDIIKEELTLTYSGNNVAYKLEKSANGNYEDNFKIGGVSYSVLLDFSIINQTKIVLNNWPGTDGMMKSALYLDDTYSNSFKLKGTSNSYYFDFEEEKLIFNYWENNVIKKLAMEKFGDVYVGTFKVGGMSYPVTVDFSFDSPVMTLFGWPGTS